MAVSKSVKPAAPVEQAQVQEQVHLELARASRYLYKNTLYLKGTVYVFTAEGAKHIFSLRDPQGLPVFIKAKARTKLVEIPVEAQTVAIRAVVPEEEAAVATEYSDPVGKLDLGDDDPEILAKLAAADADPELVDTAVSVSV